MLVYCGQTVGWTKMPFGTEVSLGPGDIVLDGDPALLSRKGHSSPTVFGPLCSGTVAVSATAELLFNCRVSMLGWAGLGARKMGWVGFQKVTYVRLCSGVSNSTSIVAVNYTLPAPCCVTRGANVYTVKLSHEDIARSTF